MSSSRAERATLYYFTHPHWDGSELGSSDAAAARLSADVRRTARWLWTIGSSALATACLAENIS